MLTVDGSLTLSDGELHLGFDVDDQTPHSMNATLAIGPTGHVTFASGWVYDGYGSVPAGIENTVRINLAPGGRLTSDTTGGGFGMRLWSEWTDATGDGRTWTNNGTDEKDTESASFEGVLRRLYAEGVLTRNGTQSGDFDRDFVYLPGATDADGTLLAAKVSGAYQAWALAMGLTPGVNDGPFDDPNGDGTPNIGHFAVDTDPLGDGTDEGKQRTASTNVGGIDYFSVTLPVRKGAVFAGTPSPSAMVDGISYTIEGSGNMVDAGLSVSEVTPANDAGLPPLRDIDGDGGADWEYRTFILEDDTLIRGFLWWVVGID